MASQGRCLRLQRLLENGLGCQFCAAKLQMTTRAKGQKLDFFLKKTSSSQQGLMLKFWFWGYNTEAGRYMELVGLHFLMPANWLDLSTKYTKTKRTRFWIYDYLFLTGVNQIPGKKPKIRNHINDTFLFMILSVIQPRSSATTIVL